MRPTLLLPAIVNSTGELLAQAACARGLHVERVGDPIPPDRLGRGHNVFLYGGPRFAGHFASELGIALLEPPDD